MTQAQTKARATVKIDRIDLMAVNKWVYGLG
jgi:hypothetical protein